MAPLRQVRVFLSSTFRDMQAEREALIKKTFPQLRRHCLERGTQLSVVDLRWGITREQAQQRKVVGLCLEMVESCRPFFVGLLGQRYGWIPESLQPRVLERHPWIAEGPRTSLTEMEIRLGALNHHAHDVRALFYLRDPGYLDRMTAADRARFLDESGSSRERLERLRREIVESDHAATEYLEPDDLAAAVLSDLKTLLAGMLTAAPPPREKRRRLHIEIMEDPAGTRRVQQELFDYWRIRNGVVDRAFRDLFVDSQGRLETLQRLTSGRAPAVACVGPPGAGKSRTLCELRRSAARAPAPPVTVSCHTAEMPVGKVLAYVTWAVGRATGDDVWHGLEATDGDLRTTLERASKRANVLITIDEVDVDSRSTLERLYACLPPGCTLVVAAESADRLPGEWEILELTPPSADEVREYSSRYLAGHGKTLSEDQQARLSGATSFATFGALASTAEELRTFGRFEELDEVIDTFAAAASSAELYENIIDRLLEDLGADDGTRLVDLLGAVVLEPGGRLTDGDAAELLGLPLLEWMELRTVCQPLFEEEATYEVVLRDEVARIARRHVEADERARRAIHARLARVFHEDAERTAYHLREAGQLAELEELLQDVATAVRLGEALDTHWSELPEAAHRRLLEGFASQVRAGFDHRGRYTDFLMLEAFIERQNLATAPLRVEDVLSLDTRPPESHHAVTVVAVCSVLWRTELTLAVVRDVLSRDDLPVLRGVPNPRAFWLWLAAIAEARLGDPQEARLHSRETVATLLEAPSDPRLLVDAASLLANVAFQYGETDVAVAELLERALAEPAFQDPGDRERRLETTREAAWIYCNGGHYEPGLRLFRRLRDALGSDDAPATVARALVGEAHASVQLGRSGHALGVAKEALETGMVGDRSPDLPELVRFFADLVRETGAHDSTSIGLLERVLEGDELAGAKHAVLRVRVAHSVAFALWRARADLQRARLLFRQTRRTLDENLHAVWCGEAWAGEAYTWVAEKRYDVALDSMERAIPLLAASGAEGRASWAVASSRRATILSHLDRHDEADRASASLVRELESRDPPPKELLDVLRARVDILSRAGREAEAAAVARHIDGSSRSTPPPGPSDPRS